MKQRYKVTREWPIVFLTLKTLIPAFVQEIVSRLRSAVRMLVVSRLSDLNNVFTIHIPPIENHKQNNLVLSEQKRFSKTTTQDF